MTGSRRFKTTPRAESGYSPAVTYRPRVPGWASASPLDASRSCEYLVPAHARHACPPPSFSCLPFHACRQNAQSLFLFPPLSILRCAIHKQNKHHRAQRLLCLLQGHAPSHVPGGSPRGLGPRRRHDSPDGRAHSLRRFQPPSSRAPSAPSSHHGPRTHNYHRRRYHARVRRPPGHEWRGRRAHPRADAIRRRVCLRRDLERHRWTGRRCLAQGRPGEGRTATHPRRGLRG